MSGTTRKINVNRVEVEKTGTRGGRGWTLYRVYATELDGTPITDVLKTFDAVNGVVEVTFDPYVKDGKVENYTIKIVRDKARRQDTPSGGERSDNQRITELESRVTDLERKLNALIRSIDTPLEVNQ
jgi:hypothetical protein